MSRKTKIIIGVVIVLLVAAGAALWWFLRARLAVEPIAGEFPAAGEQEFPEEAIAPTEVPTAPFRPVLRQLTTEPVAGAVTGTKAKETIVRYLDRATGNAYEISAEGGEARRLTNTTIPKIYEALWSKNGVSVLARYLKEDSETIETFSGSIRPKSGGEGDLVGVFLPQNITAVAFSPDGRELAYLREERGGAALIKAAAPSGSGRTEIFRSPVREWMVLWSAPQTIGLLTKSSAVAEGMLGVISASGGEMRPLLRTIAGLTALPDHAFGQVLYSASTESGFSLAALDATTNASRPIAFTTLPEKCVWTKNNSSLYCGVPTTVPGGSYPDAWYQGVVSFTDEVWKVGVAEGGTELIVDVSGEAAAPIDVVEPQLSPDEKFLVFQNKNDGTLWSLQLKE